MDQPLKNISIRQGTSFETSGERVPETPREENYGGKKEKQNKIVKVFDFMITASLAFIFFGLPLFFTGLTFQGIAFEKQIFFYAFMLLALVAWVSKGVIIGELKIKRTPLDIPIAVFWLLYLLSTIFSVDRWHSFWGFFGDPSRGFLSVTALIIAYYLIFSNFTEKRLKWMLGGLITSATIVSIWSLLALTGIKFLPEKLASLAPLSLIGSISGLGIFISFMLPIIIIAIFQISKREGKKSGNIILIAALILSLIVHIADLLLIYAYVPWPALLVGLGLFLIYILSRVVRPSEIWIWIPMLVFVAALAILMIGNNTLARINLPVEVSPNYKLSWNVAWEGAKDKFAVGSGPATYGYDFSLYKDQDFNKNILYNLRFYQGTGAFFEALPTIGALGTIALILLTLSFLSVSLYLLSKEKEKNKMYSLGILSAAIILIISSFMGRTEGAILILAGIIGALSLQTLLWESNSEGKFLNLSLKSSPKYALALAFVFMIVTAGVAYLFVFIGKAFAADMHAGKASRQREVSESGSAAKLLKAVSLYNKESRYYTRLGQEFMILANNEMLKGEKERNLDVVRSNLNRSIAASVAGRDLAKKDVLAVESLAQTYENAGFYVADSLKLAEETYKQAQELEPRNPNYFLKLGQIKIALAAAGKDENEKKQLVGEARDLFQKSLEEKADFSAGFYQLALAKEALGEIDSAIEDMGKAVMAERNNVNYLFNLGRLYQQRGKDEDNKIAESLYKRVIEINEKEINAHFSLGVLYEKTDRKKEASDEYKKALDLLPENSGETKSRVEKMISNIESGISNLTESSTIEDQNPVQNNE